MKFIGSRAFIRRNRRQNNTNSRPNQDQNASNKRQDINPTPTLIQVKPKQTKTNKPSTKEPQQENSVDSNYIMTLNARNLQDMLLRSAKCTKNCCSSPNKKKSQETTRGRVTSFINEQPYHLNDFDLGELFFINEQHY